MSPLYYLNRLEDFLELGSNVHLIKIIYQLSDKGQGLSVNEVLSNEADMTSLPIVK